MRAYWAFFTTSLREETRYFFDVCVGSVGYLGFTLLAVLLYAATGQDFFFGMFTWSMLVWYLIIAELLIANQAGVIKTISNQVQSGDIVSMINKPFHYPLALLGKHLGSVLAESVAIILLLIPAGLIIAGTAPLTLFGIVFGLVTIALAFVLDYFIAVPIGLLAFWTEDARPYQWIYGKLLFILGGLLFPLEVYPGWFQTIAKLLPTAFLIYYPARLFVDFSWDLLARVLLGQLAYLLLFGFIALWVYRKAVRRVSINGG